MRTRDRLLGLRDWIRDELCAGRLLKAPAADMDLAKISYQEPAVFIGYQPMRPEETGYGAQNPVNVAPSITVLLDEGYVKYTEEQHFDRYKNIHRSQELGQDLNVSLLFMVYEPGVRMPGFQDAAEQGSYDPALITEGSQEGLFELTDWMDDGKDKLLAQGFIPGTDLFIVDAKMTYRPYMDQNFAVDKRLVYYGFLNVGFKCYADNGMNPSVNDFLK